MNLHMPYATSSLTLMNRIWLSLTTAALLLAGVLLGVLAFWLFWPYEGVEKWEFTFDTPVARQGELLRWRVDYCVDGNVPLPVVIQRELELQNHVVVFPMPDISHPIVSRCETKHRVMGVPEYAPPGVYRFQITTAVQVNPIRVIRQTWTSPLFRIEARQ